MYRKGQRILDENLNEESENELVLIFKDLAKGLELFELL
jgi:hypothetical protein